MSNVGKARTAEEIQKDWDENPRWANVERDYTACLLYTSDAADE